ncbi:MAG: 50S ribosomal protein L11 methyltransferase [Clostridia bacterium]|nr:50S ribosomal protein L11 methyltransferase [Clostridia bacterium]
MTWSRLKITLSGGASPLFVEEISNLLVIAGVETFTVEDFSDLEETLSGGGIFYDYIDDELLKSEDKTPVIYAYFGTDEEGMATYEKALSALIDLKGKSSNYSSLLWSLDTVRDEDWENNWRQYFKPFQVGNKLVVKPTWEELPDELRADRRVIEIDPSSSFGTGSHATTKLCMERLEEIITGGEHLLDMGCGSGILTIAGMKLGAGDAVAVDIDEVAARIAAENMEQNGLGENQVRVYDGDVLESRELYEKIGGDFDVICANIVAGIIIMMSDMFFEKLTVGGTLIASGIISEREDEVRLALEKSGFSIEKTASSDDWSVIVAKKVK